MTKINYGVDEDIAGKIIFIDGITRAGKTMFNNIIPSLDGVEHTKVFPLLEYIVPAMAFGTIDHGYAKSLIRIELNELTYNNYLARDTNFRYGDLTGIHNYKEPRIYYERLFIKDGDAIIEQMRKSNKSIPIRTHELLVNLEHLNKLGINYRMLELFRHPIDNIHSWWVRGWGDRFGTDPRGFTLTIEHNDHRLPWFASEYVNEWLEFNSMERCIHAVINLIERSLFQYKKANESEKGKIYILTYEDFLTNPKGKIAEISKFLGTGVSLYTEYLLKKELRASKLSPEDRKRKIDDFKRGARRELFKNLMDISDFYESSFYELQ